MDTNQKSIFAAVSYSYICMIDSYLNVLKNPCFSSFEYFDEEVTSILSDLKTLFTTLPSLLDGDSEFKETYAQNLVNYRQTLEEKFRNLSAYKRELMHLTSLYNLKSSLHEATYEDYHLSEEEANNMDFSMLAKDCCSFVFAEKVPHKRQERAASLLPYIPMRMTKDSFLSYIEKSLQKVTIEDTPENAKFLTSVLLQLFDGHLYEQYGTSFVDLRRSLEELQLIEDPEDFFEEADLTNETLDFAIDLLQNLYHMICSFSNLLIFDALSFETLTDLHVSFYDLYCTIQNILTDSDDKDIFLETLPERVTSIKEELSDRYKKACKNKEIDPLFVLMQTYLSMSIHHVFGFDAGKHEPYSQEVLNVLKDFMSDLRAKLNTLSPIPRKLRMQYFMSVMPFIMNEQTFYHYVMQGFENVTDPKRNLFTMMYLSNVLEEKGFFDSLRNVEQDAYVPYDFEDDYYDDAPLYGTTSHDHCGCGHDHHHDDHHNCQCDHHHS